MSSVDLIANYLPLKEHTTGSSTSILSCPKCPMLSGPTYLQAFQDLKSRKILQLPPGMMRDFKRFLKAHAQKQMVSVDEYFTVFLRSQEHLKVTVEGLFMSYNFKSLNPVYMVLEHLRTTLDAVNTYDDIAAHSAEIFLLLKGQTLKLTLDGCKKDRYSVKGITSENAGELSFFIGSHMIDLLSLYKTSYGVIVEHPNTPCLQLECTSYKYNEIKIVPFEFCYIISDLRPSNELRLFDPADRLERISQMAVDEYLVSNNQKLLHTFNIEVEPTLKEVRGKVLKPPKLLLGSAKQGLQAMTVNEKIEKWDYGCLLGDTKSGGTKATVCNAITLKNWLLVSFHDRKYFDLNSFLNRFTQQCQKIGINVKKPLSTLREFIQDYQTHEQFEGFLARALKDYGQPQLIVCVMPYTHKGYKLLKYFAETHFGVRTQFFMEGQARDAPDSFFISLALKINAKLGGVNIQFDESPFDNDEVMVVGADVNHPAENDTDVPSIAAVVGSVDGRLARRYIARFSEELERTEEITNFGIMVMDLVENFEAINGVKPKKIIVFRDGVGLDQFDMVIGKELGSLKKLFTKEYAPLVTLVLVVKRHSTRLFRSGENIESRNIRAGTVVDDEIVDSLYPNFFLCSHYANYGTARPKHFHILHNDCQMGVEEIQKMAFHLCYVSAHNTSAIPLVTPIHYADLAAYRGRLHYNMMKVTGSVIQQPSTNMEFHNTMFFV